MFSINSYSAAVGAVRSVASIVSYVNIEANDVDRQVQAWFKSIPAPVDEQKMFRIDWAEWLAGWKTWKKTWDLFPSTSMTGDLKEADTTREDANRYSTELSEWKDKFNKMKGTFIFVMEESPAKTALLFAVVGGSVYLIYRFLKGLRA